MDVEFNKYLNKLVKEGVFPGCSYCIITNDKIIKGSVGYKALIPNKEKNDINALHDIASLTKLLVTNLLIALLLRDKLIDLNDYVIKYLPNFKYDNVKIIHLLTHSSGIKPLFDKFNIKSKDEFLTNIELEFTPGTSAHYIDNNFILLGFIVEKIYNKPIDILANELIFKPLEMRDTSYNPTDTERCVPTEDTKDRGLVKGFVHDEKAYFLNGVAGHAGVFSTIDDLSHFLEMILHDGYYKGKQIIDKTYIDLWFTPLFISEDSIRRTVGWIYAKSSVLAQDICSDDTIIHTGFPGHEILIDRANDFAFVMLSNRIHPTRDNKLLLEKRKDINKKLYSLLKKYEMIY